MEALVTTEWLAGELGARDLRIVDATNFLPEHKRDARAEYEAGHIPGALFLDLATLADKASPLPATFPPPEAVASRMQALGIGDGRRIVLYDDSPVKTAARAWWILHTYGTPDVAILDGGLAKWKAEGRPLERDTPAPRPAHFTIRRPAEGVRSFAEVKAVAASGSEQIADARSPARFAGTEPEARPGLAAGHIPGSRNLHYAGFFHPDGTWKRGGELRGVFERAGIEVGKPLLTTCGSGVTACVILFGAHLLGHRGTLYDGSWSEWGGDPSTPKTRGA